jgi:hypothetical protein
MNKEQGSMQFGLFLLILCKNKFNFFKFFLQKMKSKKKITAKKKKWMRVVKEYMKRMYMKMKIN